jgi:hypothetical protein
VARSDTPTATHYSPRPSGFELSGPHNFPPPVLPCRLRAIAMPSSAVAELNRNWLI